jgi:uncharacterized membrane protein (DUF2068 family)
MKNLFNPGRHGFKLSGIYKLISGALALAQGIGLVRFLDHDPGPRAERIINHLGLDPHNQLIHSVIERLTGIDRVHLLAVEVGTFCYALLHAIEGIGLLLGRNWAGYLVIGATSTLIPFEIYELARKFGPLRVAFLVVNAGFVIYLIIALRKEYQARERQPS